MYKTVLFFYLITYYLLTTQNDSFIFYHNRKTTVYIMSTRYDLNRINSVDQAIAVQDTVWNLPQGVTDLLRHESSLPL